MANDFFRFTQILPFGESDMRWPTTLVFCPLDTVRTHDTNDDHDIPGNVESITIIANVDPARACVERDTYGVMKQGDFWALVGWVLTIGANKEDLDDDSWDVVILEGIKELKLEVTPIKEKEDD